MNNIVTIALISFAAWLVAVIFRELNSNDQWKIAVDRAIGAIELGDEFYSCDAIHNASSHCNVLRGKYKRFLKENYQKAIKYIDGSDNIWLEDDYQTIGNRVHMLKRFRETL